MARVRIPSVLRALTGGVADVVATGSTVRNVFTDLERRHPGLSARLLDDRGQLKPFIRVFIGPAAAELDTAVSDRDEIAIVAAVAGGALHEAQIQRYARHILLPDVGGIGQAALLAATATVDLPAEDALAELIAIGFAAAGGVGAIALTGGTTDAVGTREVGGPTLGASDVGRSRAAALSDRLAALAPDCQLTAGPTGRPLAVPAVAAWFPSSPNDRVARALWSGGVAAVRWMADAVARARASNPEAPAAIAIPNELLAAIYAHARAAFPAECCGYLVGAAGSGQPTAVDAVIECRNAHADGHHAERSSETAFAIAGSELFAFARSFDGPRPARIVYHSHTNGRAYFSALDHAVAHSPGEPPEYPVQHLVIGVTTSGVTEAVQLAWSAATTAFIEVARWTAPESGGAGDQARR